jgi:hypothetical protein
VLKLVGGSTAVKKTRQNLPLPSTKERKKNSYRSEDHLKVDILLPKMWKIEKCPLADIAIIIKSCFSFLFEDELASALTSGVLILPHLSRAHYRGRKAA